MLKIGYTYRFFTVPAYHSIFVMYFVYKQRRVIYADKTLRLFKMFYHFFKFVKRARFFSRLRFIPLERFPRDIHFFTESDDFVYVQKEGIILFFALPDSMRARIASAVLPAMTTDSSVIPLS